MTKDLIQRKTNLRDQTRKKVKLGYEQAKWTINFKMPIYPGIPILYPFLLLGIVLIFSWQMECHKDVLDPLNNSILNFVWVNE